MRFARQLTSDPRHFQLAMLSTLLVYGLIWLRLEVGLVQVGTTLVTAILTQVAMSRVVKLPSIDLRSALISGLSLCLLLRAQELGFVVFGASVSIASKFVLRAKSKHIFNPTNFGLCVALVASDKVWVSPGQWGSEALAAFGFVCLGYLVVHRSRRSDVTIAFLAAHAALLFFRAALLGDPMSIPLHQLESGSLLLFAFFMISDPKTTPDSRAGRVVFAILVAALAYFIRFKLFLNNSLLYSLVAVSTLTWFFDRILPGIRYEWPRWGAEPSVSDGASGVT